MCKGSGTTNIEEVKTKGIFIFVANVAKMPTFFLSSSASIEWTQPQVPIWWSIRTMAVSWMLNCWVKCDLSAVEAMVDSF